LRDVTGDDGTPDTLTVTNGATVRSCLISCVK
jgi:hypothetical protein